MIDSHCHLTYDKLHPQLDAVLQRATAAGVHRIITIGTTVADAHRAIAVCKDHPNVRCAVGIHPHHSAEATDADLATLRTLEHDPHVLALGEMGLDYHYDFSPRDRQKHIFLAQLQLAREANRPIVIHCREAVDDCLAILNDFPELTADFHCFTGTKDEARRILDRGHLLGFTGILTYKRSDDLREIARTIPADRMLVETDAPYLAPEPVRKHKANEPSFVIHTAATLAQVRRTTVEEIDRLTTQNVRRFFRWT
jgi:TatD DNase family protein